MCAAALLATILSGCTAPGQVPVPSSPQSSGSAEAGASGSASGGASDGQITPGQGQVGIPAIVSNVQPSVVTVFTDSGLGSGVVYSKDGLILTN
jgi:hypothetical protein